MNFTIKDFPSEKLEVYGISKKEQNAAFGYEEMQKLLDGKKTDIVRLQFQKNGISHDLDARFSLKRNPDNSVSLMVHQTEKDQTKQLNLSSNEMERLKRGETIQTSQNNDPFLTQLDSKTNQILRIQQAKLIVPDFIQDIELGLDQKAALREGRAIELRKGDMKLDVKLDFKQRSGFSVKQTELKIERKKGNQISY